MKKGLYRIRQFSTELFIDLGLLILSIFLFVLASKYPTMARSFPQLVLILVAILTSADILEKVWIGGKKESEQKAIQVPTSQAYSTVEEKSGQWGREMKGQEVRVFYTVVLMLVFSLFMLLFGFTLGTFIFLIFSAWSLGYKKIKGLTISSLLSTGLMYLIFILVMKSFLPRGLIFDLFGR